jgi:hypothetical protein
MYVSFDEFPEEKLNKERDAMFEAGAAGEKLPGYINAAKDTHSKNISAMYTTLALFEGDELKKRPRLGLTKRIEQERKWVKHFEACIGEFKKGTQVAKAKEETEKAKEKGEKKEKQIRKEYEERMAALRKELYVTLRAKFREEWDKENKPKKKKGFWSWLFGSDDDTKDEKSVEMAAKEIATAGTGRKMFGFREKKQE